MKGLGKPTDRAKGHLHSASSPAEQRTTCRAKNHLPSKQSLVELRSTSRRKNHHSSKGSLAGHKATRRAKHDFTNKGPRTKKRMICRIQGQNATRTESKSKSIELSQTILSKYKKQSQSTGPFAKHRTNGNAYCI